MNDSLSLVIPYDLIGIFVLIILGVVFVLSIIGLVLAYLMIKNRRVFLPKLMVFLWDFLYLPLKKISKKLGFNDNIISEINVELRNLAYANEFRKIKYKDKLVFLPQCLRATDCIATLNVNEGIICKKCGKCPIPRITEKAEKLGYKKVYVAPGGTFVKRIVKRTKPKAIFAVGCLDELGLGGLLISYFGISGKSVPLLRDGCVSTEVDIEEVMDALEN